MGVHTSGTSILTFALLPEQEVSLVLSLAVNSSLFREIFDQTMSKEFAFVSDQTGFPSVINVVFLLHCISLLSFRFEKQAVFPKLLCANAEDFSLANTAFNRDAVKAGTGRRYVDS